MGRIRDALTFRATAQQAITTLKQPDQWVVDWFGGGENTASGEEVTVDSAHKHAAYWACINLLSQTVASLPYHTKKKRDGRGQDNATTHPLYSLLKNAPNPEMSSFNWRQTGMGHLLSWGNFYNRIEYKNNGQIMSIWPMRPDRMKVKRVNGLIIYEYQNSENTSDVSNYSADEIFHIPGYGFDGLVGYSPTRMAMEQLGWSMATVKFGARFFGNRSTPSGVLSHPRNVSEPAAQRMKARVEAATSGKNQQKLLVLEEGLTWQQIGIPQNEAQFIETMNFQTEDVCRWFNVPPALVHHLARATFSNVEHMDLSYSKHSVRPWCVRWEQEVDRQLLMPREVGTIFTKMELDALLRGDTQTRIESYAKGRQWGWLSANDVRELEDKNPIEGGDTYLRPVNMVDAAEPTAAPEQDGDVPKNAAGETQGGPGDDDSVPEGTRLATAKKERRALLGQIRRDIRNGGIGFFEDAAARLARRESKAMRKAHKIIGARDAASFADWLETFFRDVQQPAVERDLKPIFRAYGRQIRAAAISELGKDVDLTDAQFESLIDELALAASYRWVGSSNKGIQAVIEREIDTGGMVDALESRLDTWEQVYPNVVATSQSTNVGGAVAALVFGAAGARLVWSAGSPECDLCAAMDGRIVGREEPFLKQGETLNPSDSPDTLKAKDPITHPPLHRGCDCIIVSEEE